jgi:hypothetical protein
MDFLLHGDMLRFMEKKLTNSGPFREPADKHSIYPPEGHGEKCRRQIFQLATMFLGELKHFGFVPTGMDGRGKNGGGTGVESAGSGVVPDIRDGDREPTPAYSAATCSAMRRV